MKKSLLCLAVGMVLMAGCATRQDVITLDSRTITLEKKYADLEKKYTATREDLSSFGADRDEKYQSFSDYKAEMRAEFQRYQKELQLLGGRAEETDHRLQQHVADLSARLDAFDLRLAKVEKYLDVQAAAGGAAGSAAGSAVAAGGNNKQSEDIALYTQGKKAFDGEDYGGARSAFETLLKKFPQSDQADNAQFWIGETYYRENWYEKAILEYQKVIENYPNGNKVPAALLKQGMAFTELGDNENARLIFKDLIDRFPRSTESKIAAQKLKQ